MTVTFVAIFTKSGFDRAVKGDSFSLKPAERACRIDIEVEDDAFDSPPVPRISVKVPTPALTRSFVASVDDEESAS